MKSFEPVLRDDPERNWTCDCGYVEKYYRSKCTECGLRDTERECEQ